MGSFFYSIEFLCSKLYMEGFRLVLNKSASLGSPRSLCLLILKVSYDEMSMMSGVRTLT